MKPEDMAPITFKTACHKSQYIWLIFTLPFKTTIPHSDGFQSQAPEYHNRSHLEEEKREEEAKPVDDVRS